MTEMRVNQILPPGTLFKPQPEVGNAAPSGGEVPFGKMIKDVVGEAMDAEQDASVAIQDFAAGKVNDVHDVMLAATKANMAVQLLVQVRNGLLEAYQELSRIQV
ncbi:MAG TPA: flagellar hook-basal body complex protein FliE [bacterium]|nr:flagellar hook-basal body complex protein FliE [bacterium]